MINPRDPIPAPGAPINAQTGQPLSDRQAYHLDTLKEVGEGLYEAMHNAEGSTMPGPFQEHTWSSRRMAMAASYLEISLMLARKAALEAK